MEEVQMPEQPRRHVLKGSYLPNENKEARFKEDHFPRETAVLTLAAHPNLWGAFKH